MGQGMEQQGHSSWDRDPQVSVQLKSLELGACQHSTVRETQSVKALASKHLSQCRLQRQLDGEMHLWGHQEEFVLPFWVHLQGESEDFLLDTVDFRGLRRRQAIVHETRVDEHLRHFLILLCFVLTEIKESFQQFQIEVMHCHNGDSKHKTEQAWKQKSSQLGSCHSSSVPTPLLSLDCPLPEDNAFGYGRWPSIV